MDIAKQAAQAEAYLIELRREFHRHPEIAKEERWTSGRICEELERMGIPFDRPEADSYAVIGRIDCGLGKSIALRADMDALPMEEKADVPYKSDCPGKAHTCGHDAHMAMLLGAARMLQENRDKLHGTVYLCFQPAEEIGEGIEELITYLQARNVKHAIALHVWADHPANTLLLLDGPTMAGGNAFRAKVKGRGGHGSRPDLVNDPIKAACDLVLKWASIPSNFYDVFSPCVIHTGMIQGGKADNIFPDEVNMETGTRCFKAGGVDEIMRQIRRIADGVSTAYKVDVSLDVFQAQEPVINDPAFAARGRQIVSAMEGLELNPSTQPISASDDFCFLLQKIPGFYAFLGARNEAIGAAYPQHHSAFNIDESILKNGAEFFTRYTLDYLK